MADKVFDVAVIGGGPGGYVAAIRAAQLGLSVALAERESLGGECLNYGCIPSKLYIDYAELFERSQEAVEAGIFDAPKLDVVVKKIKEKKDGLVDKLREGIESLEKRRKVKIFEGTVSIVSVSDPKIVEISDEDGTKQVQASHVIIATGSRANILPNHAHDGVNVLTNREIFSLDTAPKHLLIVGGGVIGLEIAYFWRMFGSKVTVVEYTDMILGREDRDVVDVVLKRFKRLGIEFYVNTDVRVGSKKGSLDIIAFRAGTKEIIDEVNFSDVDKVLLATGVVPNTKGLGLKEAGVEQDNRGFITVDPQTYETNSPGIYAIGDVNGLWGLAHAASAQGEVVADIISGAKDTREIDPNLVISCIFTVPRIASFGLTEDAARAERPECSDIRVDRVDFQSVGKGVIRGMPGMAKIVVDECHGEEILGAQIVGDEADSLVTMLALVAAHEGNRESFLKVIVAHPTFGEVAKELMDKLDDKAIHNPSRGGKS